MRSQQPLVQNKAAEEREGPHSENQKNASRSGPEPRRPAMLTPLIQHEMIHDRPVVSVNTHVNQPDCKSTKTNEIFSQFDRLVFVSVSG